ncbi:hypothetical protein EYF80_007885 [Liparis tanakae]|uniref:Uncharacterized protein n=1 Tax=Liparis tanakae TaxID=230148 RepID=A0A4Z2IV62_9TELE|nr:hypothetical protein EYF80_007885 [Liparis tanakae]
MEDGYDISYGRNERCWEGLQCEICSRAENQQQHHRWKPNKLHHNTGSLSETFFLSILSSLSLNAVFSWIVSLYFYLTDWIAALDFTESRLDFGDSSCSSTQPPL